MRWQFGVASYLASGGPRRPPAGLRPLESPAQVAAFARAREATLNFVRLGLRSVPDLGSGRRGPTLVEQLEALRGEIAKLCAEGASYSATTRVAKAMGTPVQPLVADRLALPKEAGTFDLARFLTPEVRRSYEDPEVLRDWPPGEVPAVPPCGLLPLSAEWLRLLGRLDACGLLDLADPSEVPRGVNGESLVASFFATTKDAERDRTVVNRVRRNAQERRLGLVGALYPHGSSLCEVHLRPGECLRVTADDLPDYYHTCAISRQRALSNAVGRPVPLQVALRWRSWARFEAQHPMAAAQARRRGFVQPLWGALPMGDGNAVDYAQCGHCNVLRAGGALRDDHLIAYRDPWPRGPTAEGVMVDDHVVTQVVPAGSSRAAAQARVAKGAGLGASFADEDVQRCAERAYAAANLAPKASKAVRFEPRAEVWGAFVDGVRGAARSKLEVQWRALALTLDLLVLARASVGIWRAAVSLWVHVLLFRRCGLSLLHDVFAFGGETVQSGQEPDPRRVVPLRGRAASELLSLAVLSPFFETDLRAEWATELVCTDASSHWGASVAAQVRPEIVKELWRHRERRGGYVRVGDDWETLRAAASMSSERDQRIVENAARLAPGQPVPPPVVESATWLEGLVEHLPWTQRLRFQMPGSDHINVKEMRAFCADVRRVASDPREHGTRRIYGLDSRVCTGAIAKGRSSSMRLNAPLRRVLPCQLFCGLQTGANHIRTHANPADAPTRGQRPRGFEGSPLPGWVEPLLAGDFSAFDAELPPPRRRAGRKPGLIPLAAPATRRQRSLKRVAFDSTKGYPGEGPPKRTLVGRRLTNLREARVTAGERRLRATAASEFEAYLSTQGVVFDVASLPTAAVAGRFLGDYGQMLFDSGQSRSRFVRAVLAVADAHRDWRRSLQEAWDVVAAWEIEEPGRSRIPLPRSAFEAGLAVALLWDWFVFATFLMLGWTSAGRPGELLALTRGSVLLPADLGQRDSVAYVVFQNPKTGRQAHARRAARRQHARVDVFEVVAWLEVYCRALRPRDLVIPLSRSELKAAWRAVFGERLGFSTAHLEGLTPASLRAGSATALYRERDTAEPVRWRLRHGTLQMTERYIQEAVAAQALGRLPAGFRATIESLAAAAPAVLAAATEKRPVVSSSRPGPRLSAPVAADTDSDGSVGG